MEHVINDSNFESHVSNPGGICGTLPRTTQYGSLPYAAAMDVALIPWNEMPDRIAKQQKLESSLWHLWKQCGMGALNQGQYSLCWAFSSTGAVMLERVVQGAPLVVLSASSLAMPLVGFRDTGYYVEEALKGAVQQGIASTDFVPMLTTRQADFKVGWQKDAAKNKVTQWGDVPQRSAQVMLTLLLNNQPVPVGLNWWGHSVLFLQALDRYPNLAPNDYRRYGIKYLNSWGDDWGDDGCGILEGSKQLADQAYCLQQTTFEG